MLLVLVIKIAIHNVFAHAWIVPDVGRPRNLFSESADGRL